MKSSLVIESDKLKLGYRQNGQVNVVCENVTLHAAPGELIALVGRNGAGKSTLLNTLAGMNTPLAGRLLLYGKDAAKHSLADRARWMSYVSTEMIKVSNLSVYEVVALGRFPYTNWLGVLSDNDKLVVSKAIERVGLGHLSHRPVNRLSDGERQRAMVARTLAQDTSIILLDEPTAFLDLPNRFETINLLLSLAREESKTIIFSTHDLSVALHHADKMWVISESQLFEGAPEDLVLNGVFDRLFPESGLAFDAQRYIYTEPAKTKGTITLWAENELLLDITSKVLERNGFISEYTDKEQASLTVCALPEQQWTLTRNGQTDCYHSLYELSVILKLIS
jgi:iron complex transport system ATP-binding protein